MKRARVIVLSVLLLLLAVAAVSAQEPVVPGVPEDPGAPPPFDWDTAVPTQPIVDPVTGQVITYVYCNANWCVAPTPPGMTPDEFEALYLSQSGQGCWNSTGSYCVVNPNSDEAEQWLRDWAHYQYITYGNNLCVLLSEQCTIEFNFPSPPPTIYPNIPGGSGDGQSNPTFPPGTPTSGDTPGSTPPANGTPPATGPASTPVTRPTPQPTGTGGEPPSTGTPTPGGPGAGGAGGSPEIEIRLLVNRPVVVTQDPDRRGADILVIIRTQPAVFRWTETIQRCEYSDTPQPDWSGCDYDLDGDGQPDHPGDSQWRGVTEQVQRVAVVPDRLDFNTLRFTARLTDESRAWILSELARKYPGATVRKPEWDLIRDRYAHFQLLQNYIDGQKRHVVVFQATHVPFVDPGEYVISVSARTRGVWFNGRFSQPRTLQGSRILKVWLLDTTLTK